MAKNYVGKSSFSPIIKKYMLRSENIFTCQITNNLKYIILNVDRVLMNWALSYISGESVH